MSANGQMEVRMELWKNVVPDPDQPRKVFDKEKLEEMAESIKAVGIRTPIQVEPLGAKGGKGYRIIDGERRWRAAELAGVERIPVMMVDTTAPDWEKKKLAIQVVLNQQHENLSALEEAGAYRKEIESGRHTAESLYKALGVSRAHLFGRLRLNNLKGKGLEALKSGAISPSVAGLVAMVPEAQHEELLEAVSEVGYNGERMSVREVQNLIEREYVRQLKDAPFDQKDATLVPSRHRLNPKREDGLNGERILGGACTDCPFRSGNMEGAELKNPNVCTKPECFEMKLEARTKGLVLAAEKSGKKVLKGKEAEKLFQKDYNGVAHLKHSTGMIDLAGRCDPLGWDYKNNWRAALKPAFDSKDPEEQPAVVLAVDPCGELRELVSASQAEELLWGLCGHKKEKKQAISREEQSWQRVARERAKRKVAKVKVATAAAAAALPKLMGKMDKVWPLLARAAYEQTSIDAHAFVAKRRGLAEVVNEARTALEKWLKANEGNAEACREMTIDLLLLAHLGLGWESRQFGKEYRRTLEVAGVDVAKVEKEVMAAKKQKKGKADKEKKAKKK